MLTKDDLAHMTKYSRNLKIRGYLLHALAILSVITGSTILTALSISIIPVQPLSLSIALLVLSISMLISFSAIYLTFFGIDDIEDGNRIKNVVDKIIQVKPSVEPANRRQEVVFAPILSRPSELRSYRIPRGVQTVDGIQAVNDAKADSVTTAHLQWRLPQNCIRQVLLASFRNYLFQCHWKNTTPDINIPNLKSFATKNFNSVKAVSTSNIGGGDDTSDHKK